jgi:NAD-dependent SIR2 family protein deacetylase
MQSEESINLSNKKEKHQNKRKNFFVLKTKIDGLHSQADSTPPSEQ